MKAIYNAATNSIKEQPSMEHPVFTHFNHDEDFVRAQEDYKNHLSTLRVIPCGTDICRGLWKDQQVLEEGVDFTIIGGEVFPGVPQPGEGEDELWHKAINLIMAAHDKGLSKEDAVGVVKSQFSVTRKQ